MTTPKNRFIGTLCLFAARYAHDRHTGAPLATVNAIKEMWDDIPELTQKQIIEELNEASACPEDWKELRKFAENKKAGN